MIIYDHITRIEEHYYKVPHNGPMLMSGLPLPDPNKGPFLFVDCSFHPAIKKTLKRDYHNSIFVSCEFMGFDPK